MPSTNVRVTWEGELPYSNSKLFTSLNVDPDPRGKGAKQDHNRRNGTGQDTYHCQLLESLIFGNHCAEVGVKPLLLTTWLWFCWPVLNCCRQTDGSLGCVSYVNYIAVLLEDRTRFVSVTGYCIVYDCHQRRHNVISLFRRCCSLFPHIRER